MQPSGWRAYSFGSLKLLLFSNVTLLFNNCPKNMCCRLFKVHCCATEASLFIFLDLPNICLHISCGEHTFCNTVSASAHSRFILVSPSWWGTDGSGLGAEECCPASDGSGSYAARLPRTALRCLLGKGPTWLSWSLKRLDLQKTRGESAFGLDRQGTGHWEAVAEDSHPGEVV